MASCLKYIQELTPDKDLQDKLQVIHNKLFDEAHMSKMFNMYNSMLFLPPMGPKYTQAKNWIKAQNDKWGFPIMETSFTKPTSKEYLYVDASNFLWELEGEEVRDFLKQDSKQGNLFLQTSNIRNKEAVDEVFKEGDVNRIYKILGYNTFKDGNKEISNFSENEFVYKEDHYFITPSGEYEINGEKVTDKEFEEGLDANLKNLQENTVSKEKQDKAKYIFGKYLDSLEESPKDLYKGFENWYKTKYVFEQSLPQSKSTPEIIAKVKEFARNVGIRIEDLSSYAKSAGLDIDGVNGVADVLRGIIAVADGKESEALAEEAFHIALEILEQKNPGLVTSLISIIDKFQIYQTTFDEYKDRPQYQTAEGKPDIRKIKKEAVAKLLVEVVNNNSEQLTNNPALQERADLQPKTWWEIIKDWFSKLYKKSGISLFKEAADTILNSNIGSVKDILPQDGYYEQISQKQKDVISKLEATEKEITKEYAKTGDDDILANEEQANNWYSRLVDGKWVKIKNRVTDEVKKFYKNRFRNSTGFTAEQTAKNETLRKAGVDGHYTIETIIDRLVDPSTHLLRDSILDRPEISPIRGDIDFQIYRKLENYVVSLLNQFPKDSVIYKEKIIYSPKEDEAGTIDLLVLSPTDRNTYKANVIDWKFMGNNPKETDVKAVKQQGYNIQISEYKKILKNNYNIEEFGQMRAIPILMDIGTYQASGNTFIKGIAIGDADASKIEELKLLPIPTLDERTGVKEIDTILTRLNNMLKKITADKVEEDFRKTKRDRIAIIRNAIRVIQTTRDLAPLEKAMNIYSSQIDTLLKEYEGIKGNIDKLSEKEKSQLANEFIEIGDYNKYYGSVTTELRKILDADNPLHTKIRDIQTKIGIQLADLQDAKKEYADLIGKGNLVFGILIPDMVITGFKKIFKSFDDISNPAFQLINSLYNKAQSFAIEESVAMNERFLEVAKNIKDYSPLIKKGTNKLIDELSPAFFKAFKEAENKEEFIKANVVDKEKYIQEVEKVREEKIKKIQNRTPVVDNPDYEEALKQEEIDKINDKYSPLNPAFVSEILINNLDKSKWYSDEYKAIQGNKHLVEFFHLIQEVNQIAVDLGYIDYAEKRNFLPFYA